MKNDSRKYSDREQECFDSTKESLDGFYLRKQKEEVDALLQGDRNVIGRIISEIGIWNRHNPTNAVLFSSEAIVNSASGEGSEDISASRIITSIVLLPEIIPSELIASVMDAYIQLLQKRNSFAAPQYQKVNTQTVAYLQQMKRAKTSQNMLSQSISSFSFDSNTNTVSSSVPPEISKNTSFSYPLPSVASPKTQPKISETPIENNSPEDRFLKDWKAEKEPNSEWYIVKGNTQKAIQFSKTEIPKGLKVIFEVTDAKKPEDSAFPKSHIAIQGSGYKKGQKGTQGLIYTLSQSADSAFAIGEKGHIFQFFDSGIGKGGINMNAGDMNRATISIELALQELPNSRYGVVDPNDFQIVSASALVHYLQQKHSLSQEQVLSSRDFTRGYEGYTENNDVHADDFSDAVRAKIGMASAQEGKNTVAEYYAKNIPHNTPEEKYATIKQKAEHFLV